MDNLSQIYLSGSMSGANSDKAFAEAAYLLQQAGYVNVFNPSLVTYTDERFTEKPANGFREQVSHLVECDAVVFFGDWQQARGCIAELFNAVLFGCEIYTLDRTSTSVQLTRLDIGRGNVNQVISSMLVEQNKTHQKNANS